MPFEKISVTEICNQGLVSRITFYAHYDDKYKLVEEMFADYNHLKRGGRVSAMTPVAGNLLGIKPVMHCDAEGKLTPVSKARGYKGALKALVDKMAELEIEPEKINRFSFVTRIALTMWRISPDCCVSALV